MRRLLLTLLLLLPARAFAQDTPHFCDTTPSTMGTFVAGEPMNISVCHNGKDVNDNPASPSIFVLYDDGKRSTPAFEAVGAPSPVSGLTQYVLTTVVPRISGFHTIQTAILNEAGESALSEPFVLRVVIPLAKLSAPTKLTIFTPPPTPAP